MGTTYSVKVIEPPPGLDEAVIRHATEEVLAGIDLAMSSYRADSEVSRFNASASTQWFPVSADLARLVRAALEFSELSGGAFDVTLAPMVAAWGFGPAAQPVSLPQDADLDALRRRVGYRKLHVSMQPFALRKDVPDLEIDLNGIAPGYAVDLLSARLSSMGIGRHMIDIGGEVLAVGLNARGGPWRVAVERPVDAEPAPYAIVQLQDMAVTTSGEYRRYYERDGRRYSHTIDPRTGKPVAHALASVVVIGPTSMHTDAWATAFNVLGAQPGYDLAAQRQMPVMFIEWRDGRLHRRATPQFQAYLDWSEGES